MMNEKSRLKGMYEAIAEAFLSLSSVNQTHAECQNRHDSRQRGIFFNALSQQSAYMVDKGGTFAAEEDIEREENK